MPLKSNQVQSKVLYRKWHYYIFENAHSGAAEWYVNSSQQEKNKKIPAGRILQIVLVADHLDDGEGAMCF